MKERPSMCIGFKKLILICTISVVSICSVFLMGSSCFHINTLNYLTEKLNEEWGVELPGSAKLVYHLNGRGGMSDGVEYYILKIDEETDAFFDEFSSTNESTFEENVSKQLTGLSQEIGDEIPAEYMPNWDEEYCWKQIKDDEKNHFLELLYYPQKSKLHVVILYT